MSELTELTRDSDSGVATLHLNRPPMNAISSELTQELHNHFDELEKDLDTRALVLWGGPDIFAAGADIKQFPTGEGGSVSSPKDSVFELSSACSRLENLPQITIAAVNGFALGGGCEIAISTDFRVVGESAVFGQPEILLGIIPGAGGTRRLTPLIGITKAKELVYSGRRVKAEEALSLGLVSKVVPDSEVHKEALEMAAQYAKGPSALKMAKRAMQADLPEAEALALECEEFSNCFQTDDSKIGVKSFLENGPGKATFTGK